MKLDVTDNRMMSSRYLSIRHVTSVNKQLDAINYRKHLEVYIGQTHS